MPLNNETKPTNQFGYSPSLREKDLLLKNSAHHVFVFFVNISEVSYYIFHLAEKVELSSRISYKTKHIEDVSWILGPSFNSKVWTAE